MHKLAIALLLGTCVSAQAQDLDLLRMVTCQDSWQDWPAESVQLRQLGKRFNQGFVFDDKAEAFKPRTTVFLLGFRVLGVRPLTAGMSAGFSLEVDGPLGGVRAAYENAIGKDSCSIAGVDAAACEYTVDARKTGLVAGARVGRVMLGCVYSSEG